MAVVGADAQHAGLGGTGGYEDADRGEREQRAQVGHGTLLICFFGRAEPTPARHQLGEEILHHATLAVT